MGGGRLYILISAEEDNILCVIYPSGEATQPSIVGSHRGGVAIAVTSHASACTERGETIALYPPSQAKREGIVKDRDTFSDIEYVLSVGVDGFLHVNTHTGLRFRSLHMKDLGLSPELIPMSMSIHFTSGILFIGMTEQIIIARVKEIINEENIKNIKSIIPAGIAGTINCISFRQDAAGMSDMLHDYSEILLLVGRLNRSCSILHIDCKTLEEIKDKSYTFDSMSKGEDLTLYHSNSSGFPELTCCTIYTMSNYDAFLWRVEMKIIIMGIDGKGRFCTGEFSKDGDILMVAYGYDRSCGVNGIKNGKLILEANRV